MLKRNQLLLFFIFLIFVFPFVSAKSFAITNYDINYTLEQSGLISVSEKLDYKLSGCYKELFLQRPNLEIIDPIGYCQDVECVFEYKQKNTVSGVPELILKGNFCDTTITAYFNYTISKQIRALVDGTQFYYQVYPGNTKVPTNANINIIFPGDLNQTIRFIHSKDYQSIITKNTLNISKSVNAFEIIEVNILMPKDWFNQDNLYHYKDINYTKEQIIQLEQELTPQPKIKFEINNYDINYVINTSGVITAFEKIDYTINDCLTQLSVPRYDIINPVGYCDGATCNFSYVTENTLSRHPELILDGNFCDTNVTAYFSYDLEKTMIELLDGVLLRLHLYPNRMGVPTHVKISVFFPGDANNVITYISPYDGYVTKDKNTIYYLRYVTKYDTIYMTAIIPKEWFDQNSFYQLNFTVSQIIKDEDKKLKLWEESKELEKQRLKQLEEQRLLSEKRRLEQYNKSKQDLFEIKPKSKIDWLFDVNWIFDFIFHSVILLLILFLVWFLFGRDYTPKQLNYFAKYERELPSDDDPLKANYIITGDFSKDWFSSAILYLVWKKQYILEKRKDSYFLIRNNSSKSDDLPSYVKRVDKFLNKHYPEREIDLDLLQRRLKNPSIISEDYRKNFKKIFAQSNDFTKLYQKIYTEYDNWFNKKSKLFDKRGNVIATTIFVAYFVVLFYLNTFTFFMSFIMIVFGLAILLLFPKIFRYRLLFGKFSKDGRLLNLKWTNFKKYISDYSLIKEHPPKHVILWEEYMVYAAAFGVAKETSNVLGIVMPEEVGSNQVATMSGFSSISSDFSGINSFEGSGAGRGGGSSGGGGSSSSGGGGGGAGAR